MKSPIAAIVLCVLAQAASAQCTAAPTAVPTAAHLQAVNDTARPAAPAQPGTPAARPQRELIKTATASTRDDMPLVAREPRAKGEQDEPRRGGTAMLVAALALMSGIALRRYGAPRA